MYAYVYTHAQSVNNKTLNCFGVDQKRIKRQQQQRNPTKKRAQTKDSGDKPFLDRQLSQRFFFYKNF